MKGLPEHDSGLGVDYIVNNIAGCGAMLKDYDHLLRDDEQYAGKARDFATRSLDICQLILKLDPPRPAHRVERAVTYHHACHLKHAQKAGDPPLILLSWIQGLKLTPLPEADMCCGAAGTYNLSEPVMAQALAERKIKHIQETGAHIVAMGNVGCAMQIQSESHRLAADLHVVHPVTLLYEAYFGPQTQGE
jgi:glycolate oxidase iron-sulfur subunit